MTDFPQNVLALITTALMVVVGIRVVHKICLLGKQEGQLALNRSPEFCLKLTYWYLLKADHVPGDTWGGTIFGPRGTI